MTKNHHFPTNRCSFSKKGLMDSTSSEKKPLLETNSQQPPENLHAWKMNTGSFQLWAQNLAHFELKGVTLQPNHQGVLGFRPKFPPRFASGTSTTRRPLNRIFDSESSLLRDFFTQKKSWTLGKVKVMGGEMVILSDFTFQFFGVI